MNLQEKVNRLETIGITWMGPEERYLMADGEYYLLPDIDQMDDVAFEKFIVEITPQVPTIIDKSLTLIRSGSGILRTAQQRRKKADIVGNRIIARWEEAYKIEDPEKKFETLAEVDKVSNTFLVNCRDAKTQMNTDRSPITQLLAKVVEMYTEEENAMDNKKGKVPLAIQAKRDQYVKDLALEQKRKEAVAAKKARRQQQDIDARAWIKTAIGRALITFQTNMKAAWLRAFNDINLDNFEEKSARLAELKHTFPSAKVQEICKDALNLPMTNYPDLTTEELMELQNTEWEAYDFHSFYLQFGADMDTEKKNLQDRLPSKKAELDEIKRLADEKAELERRQKEAADEKEKERLRMEKERLEQQQREQQEQQQLREQQQQQELANQKNTAMATVNEAVEVSRSSAHATTLFNQAAEVAAVPEIPQTRTGFNIIVHNKNGWIEIITFWMSRCSKDLGLDKWEKKTMGSMKKDVENIALAADKVKKVDQIDSKNLTYEPEYKAVNVREKEDKK